MTGITNFFGNGTITFGKISIQETPLFDFEEYYTYAGGWPGVFENITYDWNPADGEESLSTPDFIEDFSTTTGGWS